MTASIALLTAAVAACIGVPVYLWRTRDHAPRRRATRLPAGAARARWQVVSACHRAGTTWGRALTNLVPGAGAEPAPVTTATCCAALTPKVDSPAPGNTRQPTRLATDTERRDARLDYAPGAPFTDWLSDDTIARGMKAVQ